jgi:hypothetical protein
VDHDPALVVRGAPAVHPAVLHDGLEGGRVPFIERAFRLDVMVRVEEDGGRALRSGELAEHGRMTSVELEQARIRHARLGEDVPRRLRGGTDVGRVVGRVAHRGDPHEPLELTDRARHVGGDAFAKRLVIHEGSEPTGYGESRRLVQPSPARS